MKTQLLNYLQTPKHESKNKIVVRGLEVRLMYSNCYTVCSLGMMSTLV